METKKFQKSKTQKKKTLRPRNELKRSFKLNKEKKKPKP